MKYNESVLMNLQYDPDLNDFAEYSFISLCCVLKIYKRYIIYTHKHVQ